MNVVEERIEADAAVLDVRGASRCAFGFLLFYIANTAFMKLFVSPLSSAGVETLGASPAFFITGAITGLVLGVFALVKGRNAFPAINLVGALLFVAGAAMGLACETGLLPDAGKLLCAAVVAVADTLMLLGWGRVLGARSPKEALFSVSLAYAVGSCLATACVAFAPPVVTLVVSAVCAAISAYLAATDSRVPAAGHPASPINGRAVGAPESGDSHASHASASLRDALDFLWKPVLAALFCSFITGSANVSGGGLSANSAIFVLLGTLLIGLALVAAICLPRRTFNLRQFYQVFIPLAAIVLLCVPFLDASLFPGGAAFVYVVNGCGFALLDIATISALATCSYILDVPSDIVFALERCLGAFVMVLGIYTQPVLGVSGMQTLCALILAAFLACVIVSLVRSSGGAQVGGVPVRSGEANLQTSQASPLSDEECCQELSTRGGLSAREAQVLAYLVRGRGSTFIGQELCISVQTVKTHTKHIYEKLAVHSREDLLSLVEDVRAGEKAWRDKPLSPVHEKAPPPNFSRGRGQSV